MHHFWRVIQLKLRHLFIRFQYIRICGLNVIVSPHHILAFYHHLFGTSSFEISLNHRTTFLPEIFPEPSKAESIFPKTIFHWKMTFPKIISGRGEIPENALNTAFSIIVLPKTGSQKRHFYFSLCSCAISFYIFYSFFCKEILHFKIEKSGEYCVAKSAMKKIFSSNDDPPMTKTRRSHHTSADEPSNAFQWRCVNGLFSLE